MDLIIPSSWLFTSTLLALLLSACTNIWLLTERKTIRAHPAESHNPSNLPAGWWSDPHRFQDERRAIFSQAWLCVSHRGRFQAAGDYFVYEVAGFRFFMILGKDLVVRSFHNVCRHRAFPVARKDSGSATVLGCRYHGWSYDTRGALIKAPYFDDLPGFDRSKNNLYEIHTKQDRNGFLFVNFSTRGDVPGTDPKEATKTGRVGKISAHCRFLGTIELKGKFNWKVILNNHTQSAAGSGGLLRSFSRGRTPIGELGFFPITTAHTTAGRPFWYQLTYSPDTAQQTSLRCDVYSTTPSGSFRFEGPVKENLEEQLRNMIKGLEEEHQLLVTSDRTVPSTDTHEAIALAVEKHLREEVIRGSEIRPAAVTQPFHSDAVTKAEQICQATECGDGDEKLAW